MNHLKLCKIIIYERNKETMKYLRVFSVMCNRMPWTKTHFSGRNKMDMLLK